MADVFISYAREDKPFVHRLHDALTARGLKAWVDWAGIPPTADFMQEIHAAIEAADTVLLILSPEWSGSKICRLETTHALTHKKRLIPLVCREIEAEQLLPEVAALNWIFFRESDDFAAASASLLLALDTNLDRTRALTRLLVRAIEWDAKQRDASFLLRGTDLTQAELALGEATETERPQPTPLQREYVLTSRLDAAQRQRRTFTLLTAGLIIALVLAGLAFWQYRVAETRRVAEQTARLDAERKTRIATAQRLAAQSDQALERFPQRSLLLAVEAVETVRRSGEPMVATAEQALRRALASVGGRGFGGAGLPVQNVTPSPDSRWLALGGQNATYLLDLHGPGEPLILPEPAREISGVAWGPAARWLISLGRAGTVPRLWDLTSKPPVSRPLAPPGSAEQLGFGVIGLDQRTLVTLMKDGTFTVWDLTGAEAIAGVSFQPPGPPDLEGFGLGSPKVFATGRWLGVKILGRPVRLWDLQAADPGAHPIDLPDSVDGISEMALSPDGHWLAAVGEGHVVGLWDLTAPDPSIRVRALRGHEEGIAEMAFSPDGRWLATGSFDRTARVWVLTKPDAKPLVLRGHGDMVRALSFSPDGRWLITSSTVNQLASSEKSDTSAWLWDLKLADAKPFELAGHEAGVTAAVISPDGRWAITGSNGGWVRLWDLKSENPSSAPVLLRGPERGIYALAMTRDTLATLNLDPSARVWDLRAPQRAASPLILPAPGSTTLDFSPDSRWLVAGSRDGGFLWDLAAPHPAAAQVALPDLKSAEQWTVTIAFSADAHWLAIGGDYAPVRLFDLSAPDVEAAALKLGKDGGPVAALAFTVDKHWLVVNRKYSAKEVHLWDLRASPPALLVLRGHEKPIERTALSNDGHWLVTGGEDATLRLWDLTAKEPALSPVVLKGHEKRISASRFTPDSRRLITASEEGAVRLWDLPAVATTLNSRPLPGHTAGVFDLQTSPDGRWLLTAGRDPAARLWDLAAPSPETTGQVLPDQAGEVRPVEISPDSRWMVTVDTNHVARLWNLRAPTAKALVLAGHKNGVRQWAISPDAHWLATAGNDDVVGWKDRVIRLWNLASSDPSAAPLLLLGHEDRISAMAISGDSRWLATGSGDATIRIWDLHASNPAAAPVVLPADADGVWTVRISPDSRWVAATGKDTVRLWSLRIDDLLAAARTATGRNLSLDEWELYFQGQSYRRTFSDLPAPQPAK
ncbi:MAG: hypothetical protein QOE70_3012 [Chthoniobacter sp.]|jgi:WD40 repeat protein|nr:hypothetical protein [Chthoniobacter sp.]